MSVGPIRCFIRSTDMLWFMGSLTVGSWFCLARCEYHAVPDWFVYMGLFNLFGWLGNCALHFEVA